MQSNHDAHLESDFGTPETQSQGGGVTKGYSTEGGKVVRVRHQTPLDQLLNMDKISDRQWEAAERFRQNAMTSGKFSYVKSSADFSVKGNSKDDPVDWVIKASKNYNGALAALSEEEKNIVIYVVLEEGYIRWITERKLRHTAISILCRALDVLIKFYGI